MSKQYELLLFYSVDMHCMTYGLSKGCWSCFASCFSTKSGQLARDRL